MRESSPTEESADERVQNYDNTDNAVASLKNSQRAGLWKRLQRERQQKPWRNSVIADHSVAN